MIIIRDLSHSYGKKKVLDSVNLHIEKNEICALVGKNGAGKSTLIHLMIDLLPLKTGSIYLNGIPVQKKGWKKTVSYLPEKFQLYPHLTGEENLRFFASLETGTIDEAKIEEKLKLVRLWEDRNEQVVGYSKGMLQRLGLCVMLYFDTPILILDEPTSGLDPIGRIEILSILKDLQNKTVLLSSHHLDEIKQVCTHVAYLKDGKIEKFTVGDFERKILKEGVLA
ncbi:ABC transporter ATP-binding protein [Calidifontibacillus erzurumensis]|uniref:ABC transporter ATP-binding protein n=1 Tax=Calidifontibacillus erzurumensis TaxID=2741433 RepID=A0A8J8GH14_9BACI|nr:ABC transporter ATP-binding protein [Calidifontibacillus erzurumensis]NSL51631.1 ABC transporter ATP-binding protein [Calidifontibacillus erzurumensis]